jgi:predicted PurR-regulated permease PerM
VLEPPVTWLQRHLPFKGRGVAVAITYVVTAVVAFAVITSAAVAIIQAATSFVANLPQILAQVQTALAPLVDFLGVSLPSGETIVTQSSGSSRRMRRISRTPRRRPSATRSCSWARSSPAVIISVGLAMGQVSLLRLAAALPAVEHLPGPDRARARDRRLASAASSAAGC